MNHDMECKKQGFKIFKKQLDNALWPQKENQ